MAQQRQHGMCVARRSPPCLRVVRGLCDADGVLPALVLLVRCNALVHLPAGGWVVGKEGRRTAGWQLLCQCWVLGCCSCRRGMGHPGRGQGKGHPGRGQGKQKASPHCRLSFASDATCHLQATPEGQRVARPSRTGCSLLQAPPAPAPRAALACSFACLALRQHERLSYGPLRHELRHEGAHAPRVVAVAAVLFGRLLRLLYHLQAGPEGPGGGGGGGREGGQDGRQGGRRVRGYVG